MKRTIFALLGATLVLAEPAQFTATVKGVPHVTVPSINVTAVPAKAEVKQPAEVMGGQADIKYYRLHRLITRLDTKTVEELRPVCLKLESYDRTKDTSPRMGGLHDYINRLSKDDLIAYVQKMVFKNQELFDETKFYAVTEEEAKVVEKAPQMDGGLHDYIFRQDRATLERWALASEKHYRSVNNLHLLGGLHDYINSLSNEKVAEYILAKAEKPPELNKTGKLDELCTKYGIGQLKVLQFLDAGLIGGGLHDKLRGQTKETLKHWALTAEHFSRKSNQGFFVGGLEDYIDSMTEEGLTDYILRMAKEHPVLDNAEELQKLSVEYGIAKN